jgi:carboxypeptidase Q
MTVRRWILLPAALVLLVLGLTPRIAAEEDDVAARILGSALSENGAYEKLAYLTDRVGHRMAGSESLERAVAWAVEEFKRNGIEKVWTQPVTVPHWVRGEERARIVQPVQSDMHLLALGGSVGTPQGGLTAEVIEANSFEELEALGDRVQGKIVLFNKPMETARDYGTGAGMRVNGASKAARLGAVGMLLRSLGTADFRLPHTGAMRYEDGVPQIPAAAISAEDGAHVHRLLVSGDTVQVHLELGCKSLEDAESANVIAEIPGREFPDEIVLIGAHLDSWDVGQGAHDDGTGCAMVMETLSLLRRLDLQPRRTIRAVLFTNEENGLSGGKAYAAEHDATAHVAAIEADSGCTTPSGIGVAAGPGGMAMIEEVAASLAGIGVGEVHKGGGGPDISPLRKLGVPTLNVRQDWSRYFDYHHSEADTLDKVKRRDLDLNVAAMAVLTYFLAERDESLPRLETTED